MRQKSREVGRHRVKATHGHDADALIGRMRMVAGDQIAHPGRLTADIHIVRVLAHAGGHQFITQDRKRPCGTEQDIGAGRYCVQRRGISGIGQHDVGNLAAATRLHRFQPAPVAPGNRPGPVDHVGMLCQILRRLAADKTAGTEQNQCVRTGRRRSCFFICDNTFGKCLNWRSLGIRRQQGLLPGQGVRD